MKTLDNIEKDLRKEIEEVREIEREIERLRQKLLDKIPSHFRKRDIVTALFGSLIIGLTFILKGATFKTASDLNQINLVMIIISTVIILLLEIYFVSYVRVKNKKKRRFGQFIAKRFFTLYFIAIFTSVFLVYLLGINKQAETTIQIIRLVILTSMPCAIGAAIPTLLKKY